MVSVTAAGNATVAEALCPHSVIRCQVSASAILVWRGRSVNAASPIIGTMGQEAVKVFVLLGNYIVE